MTEESIEDVKQAYALLFKENATLRAQMESQKDKWLAWAAKRADLEANAARYVFLADALTGDDIHGVLQKAFARLDHDHAPTREDFDLCIDAALKETQ